MKKEKLFELLENVDDKYIEEVMLDGLDSERPVEVRAGKTRKSPLKIIAPIAACLAVAIGAGAVYANREKFAFSPAAATSNIDFSGMTDEEVIEKCKSDVAAEAELSGAEWQTRRLDVDFDGSDEFLLYPTIESKTVKNVGVRVFKRTENAVLDLGAFGAESDSLDLNDVRSGENECYYISPGDGTYKGIRYISRDENGVGDGDYLMLVTDGKKNNDCPEGTWINGKYAGSEQGFFKRVREFPDDVADMFCEFNATELAACEKDALTRNDKLWLEELLTPGMWHAGEYDINNDGETELLISLFNFTNMKGVFVYDKNCKYLGSFETEKGLCDPEVITGYYEDGKFSWYYLGLIGPTVHYGSGYARRLEEESVNRINVENNIFSAETLMHCDIIWHDETYDNLEKFNCVYWIGDREVTWEEYNAAHICELEGYGSHEFDLTDPDVQVFSHMFEDSVLTGVNSSYDITNSGEPEN